MKKWDLILVGGGLANGLIAWRLKQRYPALNILMLEAAEQPGGNHTWSFHESDLSPVQHSWIAPLVVHRWEGYDVHFPDFSRTFNQRYYSITSERFAQAIRTLLGDGLVTQATVARVSAHDVQLADGGQFSAATVIDGRGYQPGPHLGTGYQAFVGQQWKLARPHGLERPVLMDARVTQGSGYRFVYTLPLSADTLLIEDTRYVDTPELERAAARQRIEEYARHQGWILQTLEREEHGALPITLSGDFRQFWRERGNVPASGLRAGLFHATTGYSLPLAVQLAEKMANAPGLHHAAIQPLTHRFASRIWREQRFFRLLNRMLFLAGRPQDRWQVMQRFYQLDEALIARFYAGHLRTRDMMRILTGKPPVPVIGAIRALCRTHSNRRAHS